MPDHFADAGKMVPKPSSAAQRAVCCGPVCKRPATDCVAGTYGCGIIERAKAAGFAAVLEGQGANNAK